MLKKIKIQNFRGFDSHEIPFQDMSIIVGKNNAGKSTIVEASRLIALITNRYLTASYHSTAIWVDELPLSAVGISPSVKNIGINFQTIFHRYNNPPSIITAYFDNQCTITIHLGKDGQIHAVIKDAQGSIIKTRGQAKALNLDAISIFPQVAPAQKKETILDADYVKDHMASPLSPLHFRNQLNLFPLLWQPFKDAIEDTWPGVTIKEFSKV